MADSRNADGPEFVVLNGKQLNPYPDVNGIIFSPNGDRLAYVVRDRDYNYFAVVDGREGKRYPSMMSDNNLVFSPDSKRLAYIAGRGVRRGVYFVIDGRESKRYLGAVIDFQFSPDSRRYLHSALIGSDNKWILVVDGKEEKPFDGKISNPMFSPDSNRVAYIVSKGGDNGERFVVTDGKEGKRYSGSNVWLYYALFSPNSKRIAYPVRLGKEWFVVVDDKESKRYHSVGYIAFSPDSRHIAYVAQTGSKQFVVLDGNEGKHYDRVGTPVFSPDSQLLAYAAYTNKYKKWFVVVNGQEGKSFESIIDDDVFHQASKRFIRPGNPRFDSPSQLRYLVVQNQRIYQVIETLSAPTSKSKETSRGDNKSAVSDCPLLTESDGILAGDNVSLRDTPTTESNILRMVARGTRVRILERDDHCTTIASLTGRWVRVYVMDDKATAGWLFEPYVEFAGGKPPAERIDRTVGMCHLVENPAREVSTGRYSAVNGMELLRGVANYFSGVEHWDIGLSGRVSVLQHPAHATLEHHDKSFFYYLPRKSDFRGIDRATFLVEMSGLKIKVIVEFRVMGGVPGGTEGYDPYYDKKLCPNGPYWKIS